MVLTFLVCPNVRLRPQEKISTGLRKMDWVGAFLHATTLVLFDAACIFSGSTLPWQSGVIALWVLFGIFLIIYIVQQRFSFFTEPSRRILPVAVLSNRTGLFIMLATFFCASGYSVALYYFPLYYAFTRGDDSLEVAVDMLPYICVYIAAAVGSGIFLPLVRRYALLYLLGGVLIAGGAGAMMSVNEHTSLSQSMGVGAIIGFGVGLTMQLGASVLPLALPAKIRMDSPIAMTLSLYSGTTVALAIAGCIFQNVGFELLSEALRGLNFSPGQIREALAGLESPLWVSSDRASVGAAIAAVTSAIVRIFYISAAGGAFLIICALVMKWEALDFRPAKGKDMEVGYNNTPLEPLAVGVPANRQTPDTTQH